jgi:hypothetical protein
MKKILLSIAACVALSMTSYAQTYYSQDFESTTGSALPTGWSQTVAVGAPSTTVGWNSGTNSTLSSTYFAPPAHTRFVAVNDDASSTANNTNSFLTSTSFSLASATHPYVSFDCAYLAAIDGSMAESATVEVSTDNGSTWTVVSTLAGNAQYWWETRYIDLGAYAGQSNVMLGFRYGDGGDWLYGWAIDNVMVFEPTTSDMALTAVYPTGGNNYVQDGSAGTVFTGTVFNNSGTTVTAFDITVQAGSAAAATTNVTGVSIAPFTSYNFSSNSYVVAMGSQAVTMYVTESGDVNHTNDTMATTVIGVDQLQPKTVMIEEFTQASCDPCAAAAPNVDSVYNNNRGHSLLVRYHVNWPGRDCMDTVTLSPFVSDMVSFYGVTGVPDAQMDGAYISPGAGGLSTAAINAASTGNAATGSPFKIVVTPSFDGTTNTYSFSAAITAYTNMASGLVARAVLAIDTITYASNQSTESISQTRFPQVAENMFNGSAGFSLSAFTSGSTQTINGTWTKNHAWGSARSAWAYDSTSMGNIVVWVEDNTTKTVYQAAAGSVNTVYAEGVQSVVNNIASLNVYPNPASSNAVVALNLTNADNVKMTVYNILGQEVYNIPAESRNAGHSLSTIDLTNFASGDYFVKVTVGAEVLTKKLTVSK